MTAPCLDHVAIAVPSIEGAAHLFESITGEECSPVERIESQGVNVAFVGPIELLEALEPGGAVARFLERRGPGLHHIAYRVADVKGEIARLEAEGFQPIDREPRRGARGHLVAFLHPKSSGGVLVELVEG